MDILLGAVIGAVLTYVFEWKKWKEERKILVKNFLESLKEEITSVGSI